MRRASCCVLSLFLPLVTLAGHYDVAYSGGSVTTVGPTGQTWTDTYHQDGLSLAGGSVTKDSAGAPAGRPGSVDTQGAVTITFTWNNEGDASDLPPPAVVIKESATAKWEGSSGSADNGLGSVAVAYPDGSGALSSGERFVVKENPGPSFTRSWNPSASCQVSSSGFPEGMAAGLANVTYTPTIYNIKLNLVGTTKIAGSEQLLVGQAIKPTVDLGGLPVSGEVRYTWTMPSTRVPFRNYTAAADSATLDPWGDCTTLVNNVLLYFAKPGDADIRCQVDILEPPLSFTLTNSCGIVGPTFSRGLKAFSRFYITPRENGIIEFRLTNALFKGQVQDAGIIIEDWVEQPVSFGQEVGRWGHVQLVKDLSQTRREGGDLTYVSDYHDWALDKVLPYGEWQGAGPHKPPGLPPNWYYFADDPGFINVTADFVELKVDMQFRLYVLFEPSASSAGPSMFVPISRTDWTARAEATKNEGQWSITSQASYASFVWADYPPHPLWTRKL